MSARLHLTFPEHLEQEPVIYRLGQDFGQKLPDLKHPLIGGPTVNAALIEGGSAPNVVPGKPPRIQQARPCGRRARAGGMSGERLKQGY